jgi:hypothetical protein
MFPNFTISFVALDAKLEMLTLVFSKSVFGLFLTNLKLFMTMTLLVTSFLLTSADSTSETDLAGLHLNYVGFHVSNSL